ncbi:peptide ABC transporter substrate-binding protein [Eupransor demetentiae]|uniref:Periplasmic component (OppA) n=1 Tax=Eupransor demetentiae TaxID=3109584 RepID=A0ABM9N6F0_9LACO|nr:ABC-type oligopeptide transport system [Lactobacillaceae bacterium LMG 33000]
MARWKKIAIVIISAGAIFTIGKACGWWGKTTANDPNTLSYALGADIQTMDMSKATDQYSMSIMGNTEANLLRMNAKGEPEPELAKSVDVSADGLTYTAKLRPNLRWSDGSKLTAQDFLYSWRRVVDPKTASQYAYLTSGVKNADDIVAGKKPVKSLGVSVDGDTITFKLEHPMPQFKDLLTFGTFMPQKESFVNKQGSKYGTTSDTQIYSGAYKFEGWNGTNNRFKMVKNPYYWDAKNVKTETIKWQVVNKPETIVQLYKRGVVDRAQIYTSPEIYKSNSKDKDVSNSPMAATTYLEYNQSGANKFLSNTKIRQALNLSTNRQVMVDQASGGARKVATGYAPTGLMKTPSGEDLAKYVNPHYEYDADQAKKLFAEGMQELGQKQMKVTLLTDADNPISKNMVDYLKQSWESNLKGIQVTEKIVPFKQRIQDQAAGNFDIVLNNWTGDYPDGSTFYDLFKGVDTGQNNGRFKNQTYIDAIEKSDTTDANNPEARVNDFKTAEAALKDQANINPIAFWPGYALNRKNVKGVIINATGIPIDVTHAYRTGK